MPSEAVVSIAGRGRQHGMDRRAPLTGAGPGERRADFTQIRYGQCWEDADILVQALDAGPGKRCLSIASAGDNTLALLTRSPEYVLAVDLNPAQLACLELRVAAYRGLQHEELLQLIGSAPCADRARLYRECRPHLSRKAAGFWDEHRSTIERGIGGAGKFEDYFRRFRQQVLPWVHGAGTVGRLLQPKPPGERMEFYRSTWDNRRWRVLFHLFFSRWVMGALGRDPAFFRYVEGSVAARLLARTEYALTELDPARNPYLHWILCGTHREVLPLALREEHFETIRRNLDRLEWRQSAIEELDGEARFDAFNLSDVFEYMPVEEYSRALTRLLELAQPGARLAYWNMLAPRRHPLELRARLKSLRALSSSLFARDNAFFYSDFVIEEVL